MTTRAINVVQSHTLGIATAKERILSMLEKHKGEDPHIVAGDFSWHELSHTFTASLTAYGASVVASVQITDTFVHVTTNEIDGPWVVVAIAVGVANGRVGKMLAEALR